ncbi:MAG TPA: hypothetical protein VGD77_16790 [Gemmatimonadaceae bacterium]
MNASPVLRPFRAWAVACLGLVLLAGVWMRGILMGRDWGLGTNFTFDRHAHSHLAFFGWVTLALMGAIAASLPGAASRRARLRVVAHAVGVAALAAFASFLHGGYDGASIAVSFVHVVLWVVFTLLAWGPLGVSGERSRGFFRGALVMLCLAGASTMGPAFVLAAHVTDPWVREATVKLFLGIFIGGWMGLGAMGIAYAYVDRARFDRAALALTLAGVVPAALLHAKATPPLAWLTWVGRAGTLLLGAGAVLFALDLLRSRRIPALLQVAALAALVQGTLQLLAGAGVGAALLRSPPVVIAWLHLVLVGVVTPVLLVGLGLATRAFWAVAALIAGLVVMLLSLVAMGWPAFGGVVAGQGVDVTALLRAAFAGGLLAAVGLLAMVVPVFRRADG